MIGILCSNRRERGYAEKLHSLSQKLRNQNDSPIIVFTISNIDFINNTVSGSLISGEKIRPVKVPLPSIIFNISLQREKECIKGQRFLAGMEKVILINDVNRFDQWMIMEILLASNTTKKYLLPYHIYNKKIRNFKPDDKKSYIAMPGRGSSLSRIIFAQPESDTDRVIGTQYFKKGHICDYIDASLCQKRWIFIELPDILTYNNHPVVIRTYLQQSIGGAWMVLGKNAYPRVNFKSGTDSAKVDEASLAAINHINNFIPSLGHCFIDFILDSDGNPYFLHFGGFDQHFLYQKQSMDFYKSFYKNLLNLAYYYSHMQKED